MAIVTSLRRSRHLVLHFQEAKEVRLPVDAPVWDNVTDSQLETVTFTAVNRSDMETIKHTHFSHLKYANFLK